MSPLNVSLYPFHVKHTEATAPIAILATGPHRNGLAALAANPILLKNSTRQLPKQRARQPKANPIPILSAQATAKLHR